MTPSDFSGDTGDTSVRYEMQQHGAGGNMSKRGAHRAGSAKVRLKVAQHAFQGGLVGLVLPNTHNAAALAEGGKQLVLQLQQRGQHPVPVRTGNCLGSRARPPLQIIAACQRAVPAAPSPDAFMSHANRLGHVALNVTD